LIVLKGVPCMIVSVGVEVSEKLPQG